MPLEAIVFKGGTWDGEYTDVHPGGRSVERSNRDGEGIDIYVRSEDTVEFIKTTKLRGGRTKDKVKQSTVFKFAGTRPWGPLMAAAKKGEASA